MKLHRAIGLTTAIVVALLLARPASAGDKDAKAKEDPVAEQLRLLREEVAALRKFNSLNAEAANRDFEVLNKRLDRIERTLKGMSESTSKSFFFDPAAQQGTIRLDNRLGVRALVTIDGVPYTVDPLTVRELPGQAARAFTYEVTADGYGMGLPRRTTLAGREKLTLTIY